MAKSRSEEMPAEMTKTMKNSFKFVIEYPNMDFAWTRFPPSSNCGYSELSMPANLLAVEVDRNHTPISREANRAGEVC